MVASTVIDCQSTVRAFIFDSQEGPKTVINGFTIINGSSDEDFGGAIYIGQWSSPTIVNVVIRDCNLSSGSGGAIYIGYQSSPVFNNVTISDSTAFSNGGGVYVGYMSKPVFTNCTFSNCSATFGSGGAVYCAIFSVPVFNSCHFEGNTANSNGAAVFCASGCESKFYECHFIENSITLLLDEYTGDGGAVYYGLNNIFTVENSIFTDNTARMGGGVYINSDSSGTITESDFSGNAATEDGGAIYSNMANGVSIVDSDIIGNEAVRGGGVFYVDSIIDIIGCIIEDNVANMNLDEGTIFGYGGGIFSFTSQALISDCIIRGNSARGSGGGVYLAGGPNNLLPLISVVDLTNCLIVGNDAQRDGGGVSCDWYAEALISNCTIADNRLTGMNNYGGGLYISYGSDIEVIDSIIWDNEGSNGSQITLGSGDEAFPLPSSLDITYSDIGPRYDPNAIVIFDDGELIVNNLSQGNGGATLIEGQTLYDEFDAGQQTVKVIVTLVMPAGLVESTDWNSQSSLGSMQNQIGVLQSSVLSTLTTGEFTLRHQYENLAGFSGEITSAGLDKLLANPSVAYIEPVRILTIALAQGIPLMNATQAREQFNGSGMSIAICDTGVDYTHPMLGGGGFPNAKVIGGYDMGMNDADPIPVGNAHGTNCAGIAAGDLGMVGDYIGGVAHNAKIYALKISPDNAGYATTDSMIAAWDWCVTHKNDDPDNPILVTSTSFGGGRYYNPEDADNNSPAMKAAADNANRIGITVLASSGNDGFTDSMGWPAAISSVVSVGAVYDTTDEVIGYSNTADFLDVLAPSDPTYTTDIVGAGGYDAGDYYPYFNGTSAACPFAAGAVAVLQSAVLENTGNYLSAYQVRDILNRTGDPITDTKVDITKPRVNLGAAINDIIVEPPVYIEDGSILNGEVYYDFDPLEFVWDPVSFILDIDPLFVGDYFLSQEDAGQLKTSPAVNYGSDLAINLGVDQFTTRTNSVPDGGPDGYDPNSMVDLGYHHDLFIPPTYELTTSLINAPDYMSINPNHLVPFEYNWFTEVELVISPADPNFHAINWTGTDDDTLTSLNNVVTMTSDRSVIAQFASYKLTLEVLGGLDGHGTVEANPNSPTGYYLPGTVVTLTATPEITPDPNDIDYRVKQWSGTDNDPSRLAETVTVTMNADKIVVVEFEPAIPIKIMVPDDFTDIQEAVDSAVDGDMVIVSPGTYNLAFMPSVGPGGIDFNGKEIIFTSRIDPDNPDPARIAGTIIDCGGNEYNSRRAFHLHSGEGKNTIIRGFTIINGIFSGDGQPGATGIGFAGFVPGVPRLLGATDPPDSCIDFANSGQNASGDGYGGAILIGDYTGGHPATIDPDSGSSPTIEYCVFENNVVTGAHGGDGAAGWWARWTNPCLIAAEEDPQDDAQWGGHGGHGDGNGYGGAIAILAGSTPTIRGCQFINNIARGGMGGDGGQGGSSPDNVGGVVGRGGQPGDAGSQGTVFGVPGFGGQGILGIGADGFGGAIYCDSSGSNPITIGCTFTNNAATEGVAGEAGATGGEGDALDSDADPAVIGPPLREGQVFVAETMAGGAIYAQNDQLVLDNCTFNDNEAGYERTWLFGTQPMITKGGAVYCDPNMIVSVINDSKFVDNVGGALYCSINCELYIEDSSFIGNSLPAYNGIGVPEDHFGGAVYVGDSWKKIAITNSLFIGNICDEHGGALYIGDSSGVALITSSKFSNNIANTNLSNEFLLNNLFLLNIPGLELSDDIGDGGAIASINSSDNSQISLVVTDTDFGNNRAFWGGAVYLEDFVNTSFTNCNIQSNTALNGGGMFLLGGNFKIDGGRVSGNRTTGQWAIGGGIAAEDTIADIYSCVIEGNRAEGANSYGGGIGFYVTAGSPPESIHNVTNCLILDNYASAKGGGISYEYNSAPLIQSCTFSGNTSDQEGGAVFMDWSFAEYRTAEIYNSIFAGNSGPAIYDEDTDNDATIRDCLFFDNIGGDYNNSVDTYTGSVELDSLASVTNASDSNPMFVTGPFDTYYLDPSSDAINYSTDLSSDICYDSNSVCISTLDEYTVVPDGTLDLDQLDLGFHRVAADPNNVPRYHLNIDVLSGQGTIDVSPAPDPVTDMYYEGALVTLTAYPVGINKVSNWSGGTFFDGTTEKINYYVIDGGGMPSGSTINIGIEFALIRTLYVGTNAEYESISGAIADAEDGDIIIVSPGTWSAPATFIGVSALYINKAVTVQSIDPDNPDVVANTIIDGLAFSGTEFNRLGVRFASNTGPDTVLDGFTIRNCGGYFGDPTEDGNRDDDDTYHPDGFDGGSGEGAGIYIEYGASPTIKNCIITDNFVLGGDGSDGANGRDDPQENGGRGGWPGWAQGAGVYCGQASSPTFINCTITNNMVAGGDGGNGGDDSDDTWANYGGGYVPADNVWIHSDGPEIDISEVPLWQVWEPSNIWRLTPSFNFELWTYLDDPHFYSGLGGGVFCDIDSNVTFIDCTISDNEAYGGMTGVGGLNGDRPQEPLYPFKIPSSGGGVYCGNNSRVSFTGCTITNNTADRIGYVVGDAGFDVLDTIAYRISPYVSYGGGVAAEDGAQITFEDCTISDNEAAIGGGVYWVNDAVANITNSVISNNIAYQGAGLLTTDTLAVESIIDSSTIIGNDSTVQPEPYPNFNDPDIDANADEVVFGLGAGLFAASSKITVQDTEFQLNRTNAMGGGIYFGTTELLESGSSITLRNCLVANNTAGLEGGGLIANWCFDPQISNCTFTDNTVDESAALANGIPVDIENIRDSGSAGLYSANSSTVPIIDSIFWNNDNDFYNRSGLFGYLAPRYAELSGMGVFLDGIEDLDTIISSYILSQVQDAIDLYNEDADIPTSLADVGLTDSDFAQYLSVNYGYQIGIDDGMYPAMVDIQFSDVQGGQAGVYTGVMPQNLTWGTAATWELAGNINENPIFATGLFGDYYLSFVKDTLNLQSPCVNKGSDDAKTLGYAGYTTAIEHTADANDVDMGYHRKLSLEIFTLTVIAKENDDDHYEIPQITDATGNLVWVENGTDDDGIDYKKYAGDYNQYAIVDLEVTNEVEDGSRVEWVGTNNDSLIEKTNRVTVFGDTEVTVRLVEHVQTNRLVPSQYPTIEDAVLAAISGDVIIVSRNLDGTPHYISDPDGIDFGGKRLTVMSDIDPDITVLDEATKAIIDTTIIDCQGSRDTLPRRQGRAFNFHNGEDNGSVVMGLTIVNGYITGNLGQDSAIAVPDIILGSSEIVGIGNTGADASGDGYGGAIICQADAVGRLSSPMIKFCVFNNNIVTGGQGGDGEDGPGIFGSTSEDNGVWGGDGGDGTGNGYGGAIACLDGSTPTLIECEFISNGAYGGSGGNGGDGSSPNEGNGYESNGGDAGNSSGSGFGGAVYITSSNDAVVIENCEFTNNTAAEGYQAIGGSYGPGDELPDPLPSATSGQNGTVTPQRSIATNAVQIYGGAIYYQEAAKVDISNSSFFDNEASYHTPDEDDDGIREVAYTLGGAIFCADGTTGQIYVLDPNDVDQANIFERNLGGALYLERNTDVDVSNTLFKSNKYVDYGSAIYVGPGDDRIHLTSCDFQNNDSLIVGGALALRSHADLTDCSFGGNRTVGDGGAIYASAGGIVLDVNFKDCTFAGNNARRGGGVFMQDFTANFDGSYILQNTAQDGGGAYFVTGEVTFTNGMISTNRATGQYGGAAFINTKTVIENSMIQGNLSESMKSGGGALDFRGGNTANTHEIKNCLLTDNISRANGGAISCSADVQLKVKNSTFRNNETLKYGSAIWCDHSSTPTITYSIFENCSNVAVAEDVGQANSISATISETIFFGNSEGDYGLYNIADGTSVIKTGKAGIESVPVSDTDATLNKTIIFEEDPIFVDGPLGDSYLHQNASPAVNAGSALASALGMDIFTTDPNIPVVFDKDEVDLGYHYGELETGAAGEVILSILTVEIVGCDEECGDYYEVVTPWENGYPIIGDHYEYYSGTPVTIKAIPPTGYRVASWSGGTINDVSVEEENIVIMGVDQVISIGFEQPRVITVSSTGDYKTIQHAIDAALDGDTVIVSQGIYRPTTLVMIEITGKDIVLTSTNPNDPITVANTVIDQYRFRLVDVTEKTIIDGFKFTAQYIGYHPPDPQGDSDGFDGGSVLGGSIQIYNGSPTIRNCIFTECELTGGDGADGNGNWGPGYDGGWGGRAYGGAVFMTRNSNPLFKNCIFDGCIARGGNGGDGSNGQGSNHGGRGGNWEWAPSMETGPFTLPYWFWWNGWTYGLPFDSYAIVELSHDMFVLEYGEDWTFEDLTAWEEENERLSTPGEYDDYWKYSGYGGAVYIEKFSSPRFIDCTFSNNTTYGGACGIGGSTVPTPDRNLLIENFGGAVYIADKCDVEFDSCIFTNNMANKSFEFIANNGALTIVTEPDDVYNSFGGAVCIEDNSEVQFTDCQFNNNDATTGGAVYWADSDVEMLDSELTGNTAYHGAGIYAVESTGTITNAELSSNVAQADPDILATIDTGSAGQEEGEIPVPVWDDVISGLGAGLYSTSSRVDVFDTVFENNQASVSGGAVYYGGSNETIDQMQLNNSLIIRNIAGRDGAGISSNWYAEPYISNCTVADNRIMAELWDGSGVGGGGLSSAYYSHPVIINSIFWGNGFDDPIITDVSGSQLAIGPGLYQGEGFYAPEITVTYSDIEGGESNVYLADEGSILDWDVEPGDPCYPSNIDANPYFFGNYMLSHIASGQTEDSPCIDAGSALASDLSLDTYSTRIDLVWDANEVDLGFHTRIGTVSDISDANAVAVLTLQWDSDGGVVDYEPKDTVKLKSKEVKEEEGLVTHTLTYVLNTQVIVTAIRDNKTYSIDWSGDIEEDDITDHNPEDNVEISIIGMDSNKKITVKFNLPKTITVPGDYTNIQTAINAALAGDTVKISQGVFHTTNIVVDKVITITGSNPDSPGVVANTIIDGTGFPARGFIFTENAGPGTVLNGITIANTGYGSPDPDDAEDPGQDGFDGQFAFGGGIICLPGSSPTIKNCVIRDCSISGQNGSNGSDGDEEFPRNGRGGWGGGAYGAGIYIIGQELSAFPGLGLEGILFPGVVTSPTFINCTIMNNSVTGGNGGNGADFVEIGEPPVYIMPGFGGMWSNSSNPDTSWESLQVRGAIGDYRYYSGYGGGVYCGEGTKPTFEHCLITGNTTQGGMSGIGGDNETGVRQAPIFNYEVPSYGGGVYCGAGSQVKFIDCTITDNVSPKYTVYGTGDTLAEDAPAANDEEGESRYHVDPYLGRGGGIALDQAASVRFENCYIRGNEAAIGGGIFWGYETDPCDPGSFLTGTIEIVDCNIVDNLAYLGAGVFGNRGKTEITGNLIMGNFAGADQGDIDNPNMGGQGGGIHLDAVQGAISDSHVIDNEATSSGGGIFSTSSSDGNFETVNCLIIGNEAGRDGGGISVNWYSDPFIQNCTIADNTASGSFGGDGYGGGLSAAYRSNAVVTNSIFWNNFAQFGKQIIVATDFEFDFRPSTLELSYSDVQGAWAGLYVGTGCTLMFGPPDPNNFYETNIDDDPCFVNGYYLNQPPNQIGTSPCINAGDPDASDICFEGSYGTICLDDYTTSTESDLDTDWVDMGYHYPLPVPLPPVQLDSCGLADFLTRDGVIDIYDLNVMAFWWLDMTCIGPPFCDGADLTGNGEVDYRDFALFASCWLENDADAPSPDPSLWAQGEEPKASGGTSIEMTAETATDNWGDAVEYNFICESGGCNTSGWQSDPYYLDEGLTAGWYCTYHVIARDEVGNETDPSESKGASVGDDQDPPLPDPSTWDVMPQSGPVLPTTITMTATAADDPEPYNNDMITYEFDCIEENFYDRPWELDNVYSRDDYVTGTTYSFSVRSRDSSLNQNMTGWSEPVVFVTAGTGPDTLEPVPNLMTWENPPQKEQIPALSGNWYIVMTATIAVDPVLAGYDGGYGVEYNFECLQDGSKDSGWIGTDYYQVAVDDVFDNYTFKVTARDMSPNQNATGPSCDCNSGTPLACSNNPPLCN